mmetsp:Transcript_86176/g.136032  ORF Transcript_86176/g.136032 Transcript_86176/m.136032 type:complete len:82 (+) Transcript_86176:98-343(+)
MLPIELSIFNITLLVFFLTVLLIIASPSFREEFAAKIIAGILTAWAYFQKAKRACKKKDSQKTQRQRTPPPEGSSESMKSK